MITRIHTKTDALRRYLADRMSQEERDEFEAAYMARPEVLMDLQAEAGLKAGLESLNETGELEKVPAPKSSRRLWQGVAAAALSVATLSGIAYFQLTRSAATPRILMTSIEGVAAPQLAKTHELEHMRSEADAVLLADDSRIVRLNLLLSGPRSTSSYRVSLVPIGSGDAAMVATVSGVRAASGQYPAVYLDTRHLKLGTYELEVQEERQGAGTRPSETFTIEVTTSDGRAE